MSHPKKEEGSLISPWIQREFGEERIVHGWCFAGRRYSGRIWIQPRPSYCDRGRFVAHTDLPLDNQEGWPRYYFSLETAKLEIELWLDGRKELQ